MIAIIFVHLATYILNKKWSEIMDQALKSALDKYNGKLGIINEKEKGRGSNKILMGIATIIAISLLFSVLVKYDVFGAKNIWINIKSIPIGEQTIGTIIEDFGKDFSFVLSKNSESSES